MDGNTRLCTATAAAAMRESFGSDGQPSSYSDIDECDALFLVGHNPAATGTVLWARMLDRMEHTDPPKLVVIDPRVTAVAERADVHIQTGLSLMLILEERARSNMTSLTDKYGDNEDRAWQSDVSKIAAALFPEHRRDSAGIFNLILDLEGLATLVAMVRGYLLPVTAAAKALHDTKFGTAVAKADWEYSRIESWIKSQVKVRGPQVLIVPALRSAGQL